VDSIKFAVPLSCGLCLLISCAPASPRLQSITISPLSARVAAGQTQHYAVEAHYSDGSSRPMPGMNVDWVTSDLAVATVYAPGLVTAVRQGQVKVTANVKLRSGSLTSSAVLSIDAPKTEIPTKSTGMVEAVPIVSEGRIPTDFDVANAMKSLYGNFDPSTQSSVSDLPAGAQQDSFFKTAAGIEARAFFTAGVEESGVGKVFLGTYAGPLGEGYVCHGCPPLIGMAVFVKTNAGWVVESSTKTAVFSGAWGKPPDAHILRIGPDHFGVELQVSGFSTYASILVPWNGEIRQAFGEMIGEGNGQVCGGEEGMQPCVRSEERITFQKGANPEYDDMLLTLSGTALTEHPPYKIIELTGTQRRVLSDGKYVPAGR
jgi:Bacterial Ig-like domain (group 2)